MAEASESLEYRFEEKGLRKLRRDMKKLTRDVQEVGNEALEAGEKLITAMEAGEDSVQDLDRSLDRIDTKQARIALQRLSDQLEGIDDRLDRLDGRTIDIRTDVDRDRVGGRGGRRGGGVTLPGELDEVGEVVESFRMLPGQIQALAGAAVAATAALGVGVGLAGVATKLAAELGPQGLQTDVKAVGSTFKETGREIAIAFEDVIRNQILPAGRGFARFLRGAADGLASFSGTMLRVARSFSGPLAPFSGALQAFTAGGGRAVGDALAKGVGDVTGIREIVSTMTDQIDNVRERFERGLIPKEEMLSQIEGFRMEAFQQLQKLEDRFPEAFPVALLDRLEGQLKRVRGQLKALSRVQLPDVSTPTLQKVDQAFGGEAGPIPSSVSPAGTAAGSLQQQSRMLQRVRQQIAATLSTTQRLGVRMASRVGAGLGDVIGRVITFRRRVESLGQVFLSVGGAIVRSLQRVVSQLIAAVTQAAILKSIMSLFGIGSIGGLRGSFGSIFSGLIGLDSGGFIQRDTIAMLHAGEAVVPLDQMQSVMGPSVSPIEQGFSAAWDIGLDRLRLELQRNRSFRSA